MISQVLCANVANAPSYFLNQISHIWSQSKCIHICFHSIRSVRNLKISLNALNSFGNWTEWNSNEVENIERAFICNSPNLFQINMTIDQDKQRMQWKNSPLKLNERGTQLWSFNKNVILSQARKPCQRQKNTKIWVWDVVYFLSAQFINRNMLKCRNTAANAIYLLFYFTVSFIVSSSLPITANIVRSKYRFICVYLYVNVHSAHSHFAKCYRDTVCASAVHSTDRSIDSRHKVSTTKRNIRTRKYHL